MTTAVLPGLKSLAGALSLDALPARRRISKSMAVSVVFHALLVLALLYTGGAGGQGELLTEISWLDGEPGAPPPATATPEVISAPVPSGPAPQPKHFERQEVGDIEPHPQAPALQDQLEERLASLQRQNTTTKGIAPLAVAAPVGRSLATAPGTGGPGAGGSGSLTLQRRTTSRAAPALELRRVETPPLPVAATVASAGSSPTPAKARAETVTSRELAGATLMGPVANRKLLSHAAPTYPDWAKREGVEASVRLYFIVRPDGGVQENIVVEKTSGYEDFDVNARHALLTWKFEPLQDAVGDQWGQITFRFRLSDAGVN